MVRHLGGNLKRKTLQGLVEGEPDAGLIARQLATALGTEEAPDAAEDIFWALRELFGALARTKPLVLIFEDVHWAKPRLLDLIEQLVDFSSDAPILVVCLARLELLTERPAWGGGRRNASAILLSPLSEAESRALGRVRSGAISDAHLDSVVERAEGNPLFIEQLLALLGEGDQLAPSALPPSVQAVLAARLDLLPADERAVLDHASVIGLEFWVRAMAVLMDERPEKLGHHIHQLIAKEFLRPTRSELRGEEAYRFHHVLLRDVAYLSVPKRVRADLHSRFVDWLEASHPNEGDTDEVAGHHLEQAYGYRKEVDLADTGEWESLAREAGGRYRRAGRRALIRSDMAATVRLLEKALELGDDDHPDRGQLLAEITIAYRARGQWQQARAAVASGLHAAKTDDETLRSHLRILQLETDLQQGKLSVDEALERGRREVQELVASKAGERLDHGLIFVAWLSALRGQATEAERILQRLLAKRELAPRVKLRAVRLVPTQWLYGPLPAPEGIHKCKSLLGESALGHRELAAANRSLAALTAMQGEINEARALIAGEEEKLSELGLAVVSAGALLIHAEIEILGGELPEAERLLRKGLSRLQALGETLFATEFASSLARVLFARENAHEASVIAESVAAAKSFDAAVPVQIASTKAKILALEGNCKRAVDVARSAARLADRTDLLNLQADAYRDLGDVLHLGEMQVEARRAWEEAIRRYERKGNLVSANATASKAGAPGSRTPRN